MYNLSEKNSAASVHDCRKEDSVNKITILYERLSVEDGNANESNSIQNQRRILEEYAERNGLVPYSHRSDDGYSGTGWNRPGWQSVMADVEEGKVGTVVVKNLDRMGRDYLRVGLLLEQFRELEVRFIAVGDGIDSANGYDDDLLPFRSIFAEWYARDCSRKIKAVIQSKGKSGKPTTNLPPYGYLKSPDDNNKWVLDPEAAVIVRRIFEMTIDGMGPGVIATKLYEDKVERPSYHLAQRGLGVFRNSYDRENPYAWTSPSIARILERLEYAGHTVNFKSEVVNFKSKKKVMHAHEDRLIFRDTHEAIITEEMWELVQKLRTTKRRTDTTGEANPFTGLLFCGTCGAKMHNNRSVRTRTHKKGDKSYTYTTKSSTYRCATYNQTYRKHNEKCTPHNISEPIIAQIILELLRETNGYVRQHEQEFVSLLQTNSALKKGETAKAFAKKIVKNEKRIAELEKIYRSLYEDKALGKIDETRFEEMSAGYIEEQSVLKTQTTAMQAELDAFNEDTANVEKFIELVNRYTDFTELTPAILHEFVDKIIVHEGEWSEGIYPESGRPKGKRSQKIEVYLKYIGSFNVPDERTPEEIEAEQVAKEQARIEHNRKLQREWRQRKKEEQLQAKKEIS